MKRRPKASIPMSSRMSLGLEMEMSVAVTRFLKSSKNLMALVALKRIASSEIQLELGSSKIRVRPQILFLASSMSWLSESCAASRLRF